MNLAIVGAGLIGGSIGRAARRARAADRIVAVEADPDRAAAVVAAGAADDATTDLEAGVRDADIVVLAVPVRQILALLPRLAALLAPNTIVTDVGSVKAPIARDGALHLGGRFVAGHPLAGRERHGIDAATADLFDGAAWALTPTPETAPDALEAVERFVAALGARPLLLDPERHDRIVAVTSHLPHLLAFALYEMAGERAAVDPDLFALAAGGFHSTTRVAGSSPALWTDICRTNRTEVLAAARAFEAALGRAIAALERDDAGALHAAFTRGQRPL